MVTISLDSKLFFRKLGKKIEITKMLINIIFLLGICSSVFSMPQTLDLKGNLIGISVMSPIFQYDNSKNFTGNYEYSYPTCKLIYQNDTLSTDSLMSVVHLKSSTNEECDGVLTFTLKDEFGNILSKTNITLPFNIVENETSYQIDSNETDEKSYCFDKLTSTVIDSEYTQSVICYFNISESMEVDTIAPNVVNNENDDVSTGFWAKYKWVVITCFSIVFILIIVKLTKKFWDRRDRTGRNSKHQDNGTIIYKKNQADQENQKIQIDFGN